MLRRLTLALTCLLITLPAQASCPRPGEALLAIIIDDLGYSFERGTAVIEMPVPLTLSIIPGTPHARSLAKLGTEWNKELMVHMPMSSASEVVADPIVLTNQLTEESFDLLIDQALADVPGATGLNNHMGSELTANANAMRHLMARLKKASLFFIDSRTTADTVAAEIAAEVGLPHASRSVFLDHQPGARAVSERLQVAVSRARETGAAIAIGHPHRATVAVLRESLLTLPDDVKLVPASRIVACAGDQRLTSMSRDAM